MSEFACNDGGVLTNQPRCSHMHDVRSIKFFGLRIQEPEAAENKDNQPRAQALRQHVLMERHNNGLEKP